MRAKILIIVLLITVTNCAVLPFKKQTETQKQARKFFDAYVEAFNNQDIPKLITFFDDDFAWISIQPRKIETLARGHAQLIDSFDKYFKSYPDAKTKVKRFHYEDTYIYVEEEVTFTQYGDKEKDYVRAIYNIKDGVFFRLWYFEPELEPPIRKNENK